jgi:hypothetical protein
VDFAFPGKAVHSLSNSAAIMTLLNMKGSITVNIIQLMTFHEVNTQIDQPMEHDIHRGIRGDNRNTTNLSQHLSKFHPDELKQNTSATLQQTFNRNEGTSQVTSSPFKHVRKK